MLSCMKLVCGFAAILVVAAQPALVLVWVYRIYIKYENAQRGKPDEKIVPTPSIYSLSLSLYVQFFSDGFIKGYSAC